MSKNYISKEEAINQLYETIKTKFEQDGVLQEVRCMLQTKMVTMMKGKNDIMVPRHVPTATAASTSNIASSSVDASGELQRDPRIQLLHQLIMEYFHWHGFQYSAEMFAVESNCENAKPMRECLEGVLGTYEHKTIPILLELVAELMEKNK